MEGLIAKGFIELNDGKMTETSINFFTIDNIVIIIGSSFSFFRMIGGVIGVFILEKQFERRLAEITKVYLSDSIHMTFKQKFIFLKSKLSYESIFKTVMTTEHHSEQIENMHSMII